MSNFDIENIVESRTVYNPQNIRCYSYAWQHINNVGFYPLGILIIHQSLNFFSCKYMESFWIRNEDWMVFVGSWVVGTGPLTQKRVKCLSPWPTKRTITQLKDTIYILSASYKMLPFYLFHPFQSGSPSEPYGLSVYWI